MNDENDSAPERAAVSYGRAVRTALGNNATAYGYSVSITVSYALVSGPKRSVEASETIAFAVGAAVAFVIIGASFMAMFSKGNLDESEKVATISGVVDALSVVTTVAVAYGLSRFTGFWAWPLTGAGATATFLLTGGLDVLIARAVARRTHFGDAH